LNCVEVAVKEGHKEMEEMLKRHLSAAKTSKKVSAVVETKQKKAGDKGLEEEEGKAVAAQVTQQLQLVKESVEWKQLTKLCSKQELQQQEQQLRQALQQKVNSQNDVDGERLAVAKARAELKRLEAKLASSEKSLMESEVKLESLREERRKLLKDKESSWKLKTIKKRTRLEQKLSLVRQQLKEVDEDEVEEKEDLEEELSKIQARLAKVELIKPVANETEVALFDSLQVSKYGWPKAPKNVTLFKYVGQGAQGRVYRSFYETEEKHVEAAVKYFLGGSESLEKEIKTLSSLDHPNLVKLYDFNLSLSCIVSEWIDGPCLTDFLWESDEGVDLKLSMKLSKELASALAYLHKNGIIHRDVKPDNILVETTEDGTVLRCVLVDFGIAKGYSSSTVATQAQGTFIWMSPEALRGQLSPKADVYALGMCMWQLLSGKPRPFQGLLDPTAWNNSVRVREFVVDDKNRPALLSKWPMPLNKLISACWLTDHKARPTAQQVVEALDKMKL